MGQVINHSEKQAIAINPNDVIGTLKGITPRSFEKTFQGLTSKQIEYGFSLCIQGLDRKQIAIGMNAVVENGFCPDPAMFRKWCLGIKGFSVDVDPIHASYRNKHASLANIEAWLCDSTTKITNAEREAYNRCYSMFNDLKFNYSDKQKFHTYEAFKGFYDEVVKDLVSKGIKQHDWDASLQLENKFNEFFVKPEPTVLNPEQQEKQDLIQNKIKSLVDSGVSIGVASMQVMKEMQSNKINVVID